MNCGIILLSTLPRLLSSGNGRCGRDGRNRRDWRDRGDTRSLRAGSRYPTKSLATLVVYRSIVQNTNPTIMTCIRNVFVARKCYPFSVDIKDIAAFVYPPLALSCLSKNWLHLALLSLAIT